MNIARNMEAIVVIALGLLVADGVARVAVAPKAALPTVASYSVNDTGSTVTVTAKRLNAVQKLLAA